MKTKVRKEYYKRIRKILQTELNSKNKMQAINSLAVPVVLYSYNIINWTLTELKKMDVKTRKLLTINRMHHPKADVERLYNVQCTSTYLELRRDADSFSLKVCSKHQQ